jgi:hypothetical protein
VKTVKETIIGIKNKTESHKTESYPSKDRAMHGRDKLSFLHEFIDFTLTVQFIFAFLSKYQST